MDYVIHNIRIYYMDYIIQKSISYLKKTFGLCNSETNHTSEKKASRLHHLEANLMYRKDFQIM